MNASVPLSLPQVPLDETYDVIVAGGGPAGCTAAAAAARDGARTLLIETSGALGGSGTTALVPAWCPFSDKEKIVYRGLAEFVFNRSKECTPHVAPGALDWVPIDAEGLKRIYDDLVTSHGATIRFHTQLCHVEADADGRVTRLFTASKAGIQAYSARVYIDCTGDADLVAWTGHPFHKGDQEGKRLMPATHCFQIANVNEAAFKARGMLHPGNKNSPIYAIVESGKYPRIPDLHICADLVGPGTVGFNAGHVFDVDNTDPASTSRALVEGRRLAADYHAALSEFFPEAFRNSYLVATGAQIGIRETRRIVGCYNLTLDDYLARRSFEDEICRNSYFIDIHWAKEDAAKTPEGVKKWAESNFHYERGESHGIPYRCLVPRDLRNVLVAGRSISCEQIVQGSVRVMPVCLSMGEAAGLAAARAVATAADDVRTLDATDLRARLRGYGAWLPETTSTPTETAVTA